ncbi:MAG: Asp-tRNA(Asn)/Glu-tRNA(Gln) amidotransferase subunit GatC [bacterium]
MKKATESFDFDKTCTLAHLEVPEDQKEAMKKSIDDVLGYVETLNKLPINHLAPSSHAAENELYLREDKPVKHHGLLMDENAPDWQEGAFWVPQLKA